MTEAEEDAMLAQMLSRPPKLKTCSACRKALNGQGECDCS